MRNTLIGIAAALCVMAGTTVPAYAVHWGAMSVSNDAAGIGSGVSYDAPTLEEATSAAQVQCYKHGYNGCEVKHTWIEGCGFVSVGTGPRGINGFGSGTSKADALRNCNSLGLTCLAPVGGCNHNSGK